MHAGKWRIKPSARLPIFLRFIINSSFTKERANKAEIENIMVDRTYLNHMMYWPEDQYNLFEKEVMDHIKNDDGWFERYCEREMKRAEELYSRGTDLKKVDWSEKSDDEIVGAVEETINYYRDLCCPWYVQYPSDEYIEKALEKKLAEYIPTSDPDFRRYILIFTESDKLTEVGEERLKLVKNCKEFFARDEDLDNLSSEAKTKIEEHLDQYAYINRGLATSKPYTFQDILDRIKEMKQQIDSGADIDQLIYEASEEKVAEEYKWAKEKIQPKADFQKLIDKARLHTYLRNRRVEAFFNGDYGASFIYHEIAKRAGFNPDWIMDISVPEMLGALRGEKLPSDEEMNIRFENYAMIVKDSKTELITDRDKIKELEKEYNVENEQRTEIQGKVACIGDPVQGKAKICLDKKEIGKVERGDILVAQFTTPDFVPAMEKAVAIVADQGGLSSHAAIVSRELGVPCVIATKDGTRIIKDNDLLEVDAQTGMVKILERANKKNMIKAIFFDLNGVLCVDGFRGGVAAYEKEFNMSEGSFYSIVHDFQGWKDFTLGLITEKEYLDLCAMRSEGYHFDGKKYTELVDEMTVVKKDVVMFVKTLHEQGYVIGVISNSPSEWFDRGVEKLGIQDSVDLKIISGLLHVRKPDRSIFEKALELSKTKSEESIYVDDRPDRVGGAHELGINVVEYDGNLDNLKDKIRQYD